MSTGGARNILKSGNMVFNVYFYNIDIGYILGRH